ncbi:MAG: hypothetical protein ACKVHE_28845 [Planctomycetales bacterium]
MLRDSDTGVFVFGASCHSLFRGVGVRGLPDSPVLPVDYLKSTAYDRVTASDGGGILGNLPRYSGLRWFPTLFWAKQNPERVPFLERLEKKRPR